VEIACSTQNAQLARLIEDNLPLVKHVMFQVSVRFPRHVDKDELVRAGVLGLVQAAHRYDPEKGVAFHHFAARRIRGAILDYVRSNDWAPRSVRQAGRSIEAISERLANELGRMPTSVELAAEMRLSLAELADLQRQLAQTSVLGLERTLYDVETEDMVLRGVVADAAKGPDDELVDRELHAYLRDAVALLPERHRIVIQGYFFEGRSSEELAAEVGVTVSRVSQIRTEAFAMIREGIDAQYRDRDAVRVMPFAGSESKRAASRRTAYAAAIATQRPWRARLGAA
jgi:RNA polymerase sigma factor for flagellar operon FliA